MPGGLRDSSKTRVAPVFSALGATGDAWVPQLLALGTGGAAESARAFDDDPTFVEGHWYPGERALDPPVSLLSWLIRNIEPRQLEDDAVVDKRRRLIERDPDTVAEALKLLRSNYAQRDWPRWTPAFLIAPPPRRVPFAPVFSVSPPGKSLSRVWYRLDVAA